MRPSLRSAIPAHIQSFLELLRCGGFLLDLGGRVLSFNLLAFICLGDGLTLGRDRLSAINRATDQQLQLLVEAALNKRVIHASMSVAVQRRTRPPLLIRALRLEQPDLELMPSPRLLLLVSDPELWPDLPHEILSQAFGLTRAEAEVARGIVSGKTLAKIAADRGIKVGTARACLKTVFSKTQTRGQADLTRVLTRLAFLVSNPEPRVGTMTHTDSEIVDRQQLSPPALGKLTL
jgi:DNA-binding CsgD family transcriptional regulator